jgi:hypothetical protein
MDRNRAVFFCAAGNPGHVPLPNGPMRDVAKCLHFPQANKNRAALGLTKTGTIPLCKGFSRLVLGASATHAINPIPETTYR